MSSPGPDQSPSAPGSAAETSLDPDEVVADLGERVDHGVPLGFVRDIGQTGTVADVLSVLGQWLPSIVAADRVTVALSDGRDALQLFALDGLTASVLDDEVPSSRSRIDRVFGSGQIVIARGVDGAYADFLSVPLRIRDQRIGTVNLQRRDGTAFAEADAALLQCLADIASQQLELRRQIDEAQQLALVDPLTGAANRRAFSAHGDEQLTSWRKVRKPFALGILDLDHFKELNDRYGHAAGDEVLKVVVETLRTESRAGDVVARVGGEEFAVMIAHAEEHEATSVFDRIRETLASLRIAVAGQELRITTSIGVTTAGPDDGDVAQVFARADAALYEAKRAGRNRVVFRGPDSS